MTAAASWWYLSFVDPDIAATIPEGEEMPGGHSWLGACYVDAPDQVTATTRAWDLGCNPGGEVAIFGPLSDEMMDEHVPDGQRRRLLTREEALGAVE